MKISSCLFTNRSSNFLFFHYINKWSNALKIGIEEGCSLTPEFISRDEEEQLLKEIEPYMKRLKYENSHWDHAISVYRERKLRKWNPWNETIIRRLLDTFPKEMIVSPEVHILDLHKDGFISPHIDSVKYCGEIVSGISLLSDCIMRLRHAEKKDELIVDLHLPRLSLYRLSGVGRYEFMHEILPNEESYFGAERIKVNKTRRISLICRDEPKATKLDDKHMEFKPL